MDSKTLLLIALALVATVWHCEAQQERCFRTTTLQGGEEVAAPAGEAELEETLETLGLAEEEEGLVGGKKIAIPGFPRCTVRSSNARLVRFIRVGGRTRRCTGTVRLNSCGGNCYSSYALTTTGSYFSRCACCKPISFRPVSQNIILNCGGCTLYNYNYRGVDITRCNCRSC